MWMKWYHQFAEGERNPKWSWHDLGNIDKATAVDYVKKEICPELRDEYSWSEHYRGIHFELVDVPPPEVLKDLIAEAERKAKFWTARTGWLQSLLGA